MVTICKCGSLLMLKPCSNTFFCGVDDELMIGADDSSTLSSITNETETSPTDQGVFDDELIISW